MAKRFTDSCKWDKVWFRKLTPEHKVFWVFILDNCNHAGIWEVDFEKAEFEIGCKIEKTATIQAFEKQLVSLDEGKRWFIKDFIEFQYGELHTSKIHQSVHQLLSKYIDLVNPFVRVSKELAKGYLTPKDKDKDKDTEKVKDKAKETTDINNTVSDTVNNKIRKITDNDDLDPKRKYFQFVFLRETEYGDLLKLYGDEEKLRNKIEVLNNDIGANGKRKHDNHYYVLRQWHGISFDKQTKAAQVEQQVDHSKNRDIFDPIAYKKTKTPEELKKIEDDAMARNIAFIERNNAALAQLNHE